MITTTQVVITNKFDLELINTALDYYYHHLSSVKLPGGGHSTASHVLSQEMDNTLGRVSSLRNRVNRVLHSNTNIAEPEEVTK